MERDVVPVLGQAPAKDDRKRYLLAQLEVEALRVDKEGVVFEALIG
jgi:hypothetical protein